MPNVLIIRPLDDALPLAEILKSKGVIPLLYPLFKPLFLPLPPLKDPQAFIITSKNALRAIENHESLKNIPVFTGGDETAALARTLGFSNVTSASGTSKDLIPLLLEKANPTNGILWHLSGEMIKTDLVSILQSKGFQAKRQIVYKIEGVNTLPIELQTQLLQQEISHVLFFSPETTRHFINLLNKNNLAPSAHHITSLCLSEDVAQQGSGISWKDVWISPQPTSQSMMDYFNE